jgi:hypothetical protein
MEIVAGSPDELAAHMQNRDPALGRAGEEVRRHAN